MLVYSGVRLLVKTDEVTSWKGNTWGGCYCMLQIKLERHGTHTFPVGDRQTDGWADRYVGTQTCNLSA